jgi:myo-inositol-1(or 4)-monophosphatase
MTTHPIASRKAEPLSPEALLSCAVEAVRSAGAYALKQRHRRTETVAVSPHDVKLRLDIECQELAEAVIRNRYPRHAFLGEEDGATAARERVDSEYEWVIDPIDGTVNFSHGLPRWGCSIGVRRGDTTLAGAVFAPELDELYTAVDGAPALRNGAVIHVSETRELAESIIFTGVDKHVSARLPPLEIFRGIAAAVQRPRVMGCASLDLCQVAAGQGDGYFESGIYIWDVLAAGLIVTQAGGMTEILGSLPGGRLLFMASNGKIHEAFKGILNPELAG